MVKKRKSVEEKIDDLAEMVARGFSELHETIANNATKKELKEVVSLLERIEFHTNTHERRIEMLEDKIRTISTKIGLRK